MMLFKNDLIENPFLKSNKYNEIWYIQWFSANTYSWIIRSAVDTVHC